MNKRITTLALVAFLKTAAGNEIPPGAVGLGPAHRELKKESKKKGKKGPKEAKKSKKSKSSKSAKGETSGRNLQQDLQDTLAIRDILRATYNYDLDERNECVGDTNTHRRCHYDVFRIGADFECECRPIDGAEIFEAVDENDDDHITLDEIQAYFATDECEPKFIWKGIEYTGCTTVDDANEREWCSIRTLKDGTHATGFFKYCNSEDNVLAWQEALEDYDENGDEKLSFEEAITNKKERRRQLQASNQLGGNCNDCNDAERQRCINNPIIATIDGECRNYIKTTPFDGSKEDENLLHMLGATMVDVYDYCVDPDSGSYNYVACPTLRGGMNEWITRTYLSPYPESDDWLVVGSCAVLVGARSDFILGIIESKATAFVGPVAAKAGTWLLKRFLSAIAAAIECERVFTELTDGRDALQWATYTINQGAYEGKTILAYMGTKGSNPEQIVADIWSVPLGNDMMRNMTDDAVEIALQVMEDVGGKDNLFITGHSLGGIVAELVCSELGIQGASFGAIGAFDPYSLVDQADIENTISDEEALNDYIDQYESMLLNLDYTQAEIDAEIAGIDVESFRRTLIAAEYNGLIKNTGHAGVKFEVVKNEYDYIARMIGSIDGSQCSHIASSCDVRKLWFEATSSTTHGHAGWAYMSSSNAYFSRGWEEESQSQVDYDKLFLPGVEKNVVCDICLGGRNEWCDSGNCFAGECRVGDKRPTFCPANSKLKGQRAYCPNGNDDCVSGRCEGGPLSDDQCYDKLLAGEGCNENSDCLSGSCTWWFECDSDNV